MNALMNSITIRKKTILIIFLTTLFFVLLLYGISETFFLGSFANLEDHMVLQNVDRAQLALSSDIDQLNSTETDWAGWNDTYAFILNRNQNYISANLNVESLSNLRLNLMLFVDPSGQLVFSRMLNIDTKMETPVPQNFLKNLFKKGSLVCRNESDMFKGIVLLPEGSLLISSQPILTSERNGPVRGTLIIGRYLDSELTHLSELTQLPIVMQRINDSNMSSDFVAAQSSILKEKTVLVNPLSENSIAGYALVRDVYGDPAQILRVDLPRDIYSQGKSTIYYFFIYILLIGLIFAILILFLLDKTFLSKIARLILDVHNIGLRGDFSMRIPVAGKDELSSLSCHINDMLDKIDQSDRELRKAHDELEMRIKERTEELARRNTEMERFIYTVSHDLRTPLISVSGLLGYLKQDAENGDLEQMNADLQVANEAIAKMDQLLMETLELSRVGRVVNPPEDVPFGEIVEGALEQTGEKIRSMGYKVSVAQNLPVVHVDRMRITEVLVNLIENCLKYMGLQANPEIEIGQRIDGKDRIFFVRDNGIGMDQSQHDKVFELFYKVDKKSEGTGAGLAIVKRIIEVHGGSIWIESEIGQGSTVCFTLPLANVG